MGSNLKQEAMERVGEVEHAECYYDTDRNKPLPGRAAKPVVTNDFCAMDAHARVPPTGLRLRWMAENSFAQWSASDPHNIKSFKRGYVAGFEAGHIACAAKYVQMPTAAELAGVVRVATPQPVDAAQAVPEGPRMLTTSLLRYANYVAACEAKGMPSMSLHQFAESEGESSPVAQPTDTTKGA